MYCYYHTTVRVLLDPRWSKEKQINLHINFSDKTKWKNNTYTNFSFLNGILCLKLCIFIKLKYRNGQLLHRRLSATRGRRADWNASSPHVLQFICRFLQLPCVWQFHVQKRRDCVRWLDKTVRARARARGDTRGGCTPWGDTQNKAWNEWVSVRGRSPPFFFLPVKGWSLNHLRQSWRSLGAHARLFTRRRHCRAAPTTFAGLFWSFFSFLLFFFKFSAAEVEFTPRPTWRSRDGSFRDFSRVPAGFHLHEPEHRFCGGGWKGGPGECDSLPRWPQLHPNEEPVWGPAVDLRKNCWNWGKPAGWPWGETFIHVRNFN